MARLKRLSLSEMEALGIGIPEYPTTVEGWENIVRPKEQEFLRRKHSGVFCRRCKAEMKIVDQSAQHYLACPTAGCRRELRKIFLDDLIGEEAADAYFRWKEGEEKDRMFKSVVDSSIKDSPERAREMSRRLVDMAWRVNYDGRC